MSEQYTPSIVSAQAYLVTLHTETIARQEQEIAALRRDLTIARTTIMSLSNQVRDLELDLTFDQPRQVAPPQPSIVQLRDSGLSFGAIGERLGISRQMAQKRYQKAKA